MKTDESLEENGRVRDAGQGRGPCKQERPGQLAGLLSLSSAGSLEGDGGPVRRMCFRALRTRS